ncbi:MULTISPECIES: hypothetical protein [Bradyrhizobium]|uniref:Uncharacterized protein n=1 Tax=Bradyrhizobium elkanii TaxID=29448 RepID=A0A8I1Y871_BRAEL|nr:MULTISPECIES: hypothetical protein [Bradyrhizobium]MBP1293789.1 hypothetical protein [Bradyrhizobium elkanii]MCP1925627.1 hypothetical protein [Bradyrhizobium elkanii]MCS3476881.1 hypothetical protein [Bradyrhizobium elkanii]MCS3583616.1 hypothetical protein [Bradyrhizobium elkanii]MCS3717186.1 hypothetical protein [Bradyrhizobium elkanii]
MQQLVAVIRRWATRRSVLRSIAEALQDKKMARQEAGLFIFAC